MSVYLLCIEENSGEGSREVEGRIGGIVRGEYKCVCELCR